MAWRRGSLIALLSTAAIAVAMPPAAAAPPTAAGVGGEVGAVDTLAGPGFCDGAARVDPGSVAVRAVTVDRSGVVSALAGKPDREVLFQVGGQANLRNAPLGPITSGADEASSGVMAADGSGEVFVSRGSEIAHIGAALDPGDPTLAARFVGIRALAADGAGNLYVADRAEGGREPVAIRFVNRSAEAVTFYGGTAQQVVVAPRSVGTIVGVPGDPAADGRGPAATAAIVGAPISLAVSARVLYVGAFGPAPGAAGPHGRVQAVNLTGQGLATQGIDLGPAAIGTVAGGAGPDGGRDGAKATTVDLGPLPGIAADGDGNLFLAEEAQHRVRRVDHDGTLVTVAGTGTTTGPGGERSGGGFNGNNRPATSARLNRPVDVEVSDNGVLYVADRGNGLVRRIDRSGTIRAVIGSGLGLSWSCQPAGRDAAAQPADRPRLAPVSPVADARGSVYFVSSGSGRVMRLDAAGVVTPLTDPLTPCVGAVPCKAVPGRPRVGRPAALALGPEGALYVIDGGDNRILVLNVGHGAVTALGQKVKPGEMKVVAGNGRIGGRGDGGPATRGQLNAASSIAADSHGNLFVADAGNGAVRQIDERGIITSLLPPAPDGGAAVCCVRPAAVAVAPGGNLYVAEAGGSIWLLNRGTAEVTVHGQAVPAGMSRLVAGGGGRGYLSDDGPALGTQLRAVSGIAPDGRGNLYVAEPPALVRRIDGEGMLSTAAGLGQESFNGDGLAARLTGLDGASSVALDRCGNLLIADTNNDRLRRLNLTPTCPALPTAGPGFVRSRLGWLILLLLLGVAAAAGVVSWRRSRRPA